MCCEFGSLSVVTEIRLDLWEKTGMSHTFIEKRRIGFETFVTVEQEFLLFDVFCQFCSVLSKLLLSVWFSYGRVTMARAEVRIAEDA